jgi:predicted ArsR family transcriptional regulator
MNQKLIAEIGKSQRLQILNQLKRTQGLSVKELAVLLNMSYMGIKQHCLELHKGGYLDVWRRPKLPGTLGRPEMLYRLTEKAHELFPSTSNQITIDLLESADKLYGSSAAEKLLFHVFQRKTALYTAKAKGEVIHDRARQLAKLRDQEGYMSGFIAEGGPRITEHHTPMLDLLRAYPIVARLESEMFQRVLKTNVRREENSVSGLYECTFHIG